MRFLDCEKVLIILLYYLKVNFFKISKIITGLRGTTERDQILINLKITDRQIAQLINSFKYEYDASRDKQCGRTAVKKVVDKWLSESTIKNHQRTNYTTKISRDRIDYLCKFVKSSIANRKLTLNDLRFELKMLTVSRPTVCKYLVKNGLKCRVAKTGPLLNPEHIKDRLKFVDDYVDKPESFWDDVVFVDEKLFQSFNNGRVLIRIGRDEEADNPMFRRIKDTSGRFTVNLWGYMSSKGCGIFNVGEFTRFTYAQVLQESLSVIDRLHNGIREIRFFFSISINQNSLI